MKAFIFNKNFNLKSLKFIFSLTLVSLKLLPCANIFKADKIWMVNIFELLYIIVLIFRIVSISINLHTEKQNIKKSRGIAILLWSWTQKEWEQVYLVY